MPLLIVREDITRMRVDAIVNPTNSRMEPGGGTDAAVHKSAGSGLQQECASLPPLEKGKAVITGSYNLPCRMIIHTVGPKWYDGWNREAAVLRSCYRESLELACKAGCESVAFPLIASGTLGFPKEKALKIATEEIRSFLDRFDMTVYLVVYDKSSYQLSVDLFSDVQAFIDQNYVEQHEPICYSASRPASHSGRNETCPAASREEAPRRPLFRPQPKEMAAMPMEAAAAVEMDLDLDSLIRQLDEGFSDMLFRKIDERGMTDAQCYKRANIDRKLFSKLRKPDYRPSKPTVLALAIALKLSLSETKDLLMKAGFALSNSNKFDVIVEYCIRKGIYDIYRVNEILFCYDQSLLGSL